MFPALSKTQFHPFSDFAIHHMGSNLADGVSQGGAGPDQFRTAPLWGAGQRLFFLHDGRTSDLLKAIEDHFSQGNNCVSGGSPGAAATNGSGGGSQSCASEANQVINNFNRLRPSQQQDVLDFLRSL